MDEFALIDQEFDDTEEHDDYILEKCKEIADVLRNSTDVHGS